MKRHFLFLLGMLFWAASAFSQDLTQNYYSYINNLYNINPAYCAIGHKLAGVMDVRQKTGWNETNAMVGISGQLNANQGLGARLNSDLRGPFQTFIMDATYGYKVDIAEGRALYLGLSAGLINRSLNTSKIKNYNDLDPNDPTLNVTNYKSTAFTAGAGLVYEHKSFELAISAPQLVAGNQRSFNYITVMAANIFYLSDKFELIPMLFYFNTPVVKNLGVLQLKAEYHRKFWGQIGFQTNSIFNACVGYNVGDLGFAYNYMTSNKLTNVQTSGTHEVILTLKVGKKYRNRHMAPKNDEHIE
jgi:type IX secretion system PorP/SprF family membrane protein